jgi:hypothetical protein
MILGAVKARPQRLKPLVCWARYGTAKAVP